MGILLALAPLIAFATTGAFAGPIPALMTGALVSAALHVRDLADPKRTPKLIESVTVLLFLGLTLYVAIGGCVWSMAAIRLYVDVGLFVIAIVSMMVGSPFILQYVREQDAPDFSDGPGCLRTNRIITGAWATAFAVMTIAELGLLYVPRLPPPVAIVAIVLALGGAVGFTEWYPKQAKANAGSRT
jgi:hypothetical protein